MTNHEPGHDSENYDVKRDAKPIGDWLVATGTPAGRAFGRLRSLLRSAPAVALIGAIAYFLIQYLLHSARGP